MKVEMMKERKIWDGGVQRERGREVLLILQRALLNVLQPLFYLKKTKIKVNNNNNNKKKIRKMRKKFVCLVLEGNEKKQTQGKRREEWR